MKFLAEIFDEWREIGKRGDQLEVKWLETLNKKNPKVKSEINKISEKFDFAGLEKLIFEEKEKHFESKPSLATRQCSMAAIEKISNFSPTINRWFSRFKWF